MCMTRSLVRQVRQCESRLRAHDITRSMRLTIPTHSAQLLVVQSVGVCSRTHVASFSLGAGVCSNHRAEVSSVRLCAYHSSYRLSFSSFFARRVSLSRLPWTRHHESKPLTDSQSDSSTRSWRRYLRVYVIGDQGLSLTLFTGRLLGFAPR